MCTSTMFLFKLKIDRRADMFYTHTYTHTYVGERESRKQIPIKLNCVRYKIIKIRFSIVTICSGSVIDILNLTF